MAMGLNHHSLLKIYSQNKKAGLNGRLSFQTACALYVWTLVEYAEVLFTFQFDYQ